MKNAHRTCSHVQRIDFRLTRSRRSYKNLGVSAKDWVLLIQSPMAPEIRGTKEAKMKDEVGLAHWIA